MNKTNDKASVNIWEQGKDLKIRIIKQSAMMNDGVNRQTIILQT
jgi:hypothetical protein